MNPDTATNEELRDWLAIRQGYTKINGRWHHPEYHGSGVPGHIVPNTIDAAAKCLPEGGLLTLDRERWEYRFETPKWYGFVFVPRTADERTDRFRLAVLAIETMEEGK